MSYTHVLANLTTAYVSAVGVAVIVLGGRNLWIMYNKQRENHIYYTVDTRFDNETRNLFEYDIMKIYGNVEEKNPYPAIDVQRRWKADGRWKKALEDRC